MSATALAMGPEPAMDACSRCGVEHDPTRCNGHSRDGGQCGNVRGKATEHVGYGNCASHGGCTESGIKHAEAERRRAILTLVVDAPQAVRKLREMANRDDLPPQVQLAAIRDWLDRAGVGSRNDSVTVEVTVSVEERQAELLERAKAIRAGVVLETTAGVPTPEADS